MTVAKAEFTFGPSFQVSMLNLMLIDLSFAMKVVNYIPEERLYSEAHKYLFTRIKDSIKSKGALPSYIEVEDHLKTIERVKRRMLKKFCKEIFESKPKAPEFIKEKLTEYAKRNAFIDIFQTAQTFWNSKNHGKAYEYTMEGINDLYTINFKDDANVPIEKFEEIRQVYIHNSIVGVQKIPTNIDPLDDILKGGLEKGELGILLAEPKKGKSIGLIHMGAAALMMRYGRVAHFVLEGKTEQTVLRYQSRLSGIEYNRLEKDELSTVEKQRLDDISRKYTSKLELIPFNLHWNYTVLDIEAKIKELTRVGKKPDLVVVDYGDLVRSHTAKKSENEEQTEVFRYLKSLATIQNVAIWTASQARRPDEEPEKEYLLRAKDIANCFEKVRIADIVATLNQTPKEKENGILRFHIDIYRSNDTDKTIFLISNYEKMIFYSKRLGYLKPEDLPEWKKKKKKS